MQNQVSDILDENQETWDHFSKQLKKHCDSQARMQKQVNGMQADNKGTWDRFSKQLQKLSEKQAKAAIPKGDPVVKCPYCEDKMHSSNIELHKKNCFQFPVLCQYCHIEVPICDKEDHEDDCTENPDNEGRWDDYYNC
ncbi:uncharacterized protein LOC144104342 [Amblyomma americanum]